MFYHWIRNSPVKPLKFFPTVQNHFPFPVPSTSTSTSTSNNINLTYFRKDLKEENQNKKCILY